MAKEAVAKAPVSRVKRTPVGRRNVLHVSGKEPGYVYRIVNDTGARVSTFLEAGYELVEAKDVVVGDKRVGTPTAEGSVAQVHVGGGDRAVVMRIREDWYEEDQAAKAAHIAATEEATRQSALDGNDYGKIDISRS